MLTRLTIQNIGLMRSEQIALSPGFNVITGESGSGKSVLLSALRFVLGSARLAAPVPNPDLPARVEAVFTVRPGSFEESVLGALGRRAKGPLVLSREIDERGRTRATIDGEKVPLKTLAEVGECLLASSTQGQSTLLRKPKAQLALYDSVLGLSEEARKVSELHAAWSEAKSALRQVTSELERAEARRELLEYQAAELDGLPELDFDALEEKAEALADRKRAIEAAEALLAELCPTDTTSIRQTLRAALRSAHALSAVHSEKVGALLSGALHQIEEAVYELEREIEDGRSDALEFEETLSLSQRVRDLSQKYRVAPQELSRLAAERRRELEELERRRTAATELARAVSEREAELVRAADRLHERRAKGARRATEQLALRLARLGLEAVSVRFELSLVELGPSGVSGLTVLFSPYPGAEEVPIGRAASGGELSRVLLALLLTSRSRPQSLVLDEIDAGTSGEANTRIAQALLEEGDDSQFIAVTHSPLLAAKAREHILVEKSLVPAPTSKVRVLGPEERRQELERMLGGGPTATSHAAALLGRERPLRLVAS
ncbi:MAG: hypothetical protein B6A08_02155 [Sorangiineae bacterium NIC37A_2]|jgi:DNA repair protein RecN (Recombination protein N)|nr:MAG: hypothetical protein B6A08_02155 [Sorangiineae bacterium NIC37A_2]